MKNLIGTLAVLFVIIFMVQGCGLKRVKTGTPEQALYKNDQRISAQKAAEDDGPGKNYYYFMESEIAKDHGNFDTALDFMKKAMETDPDSLYLKRELAILYLHKEDNEKALKIVEQILDKEPNSVDALVMEATIKRAIDKDADVKPIYEKVLTLDPERKSVYQILGKMYFSEDDMDNAFRIYEKMLKQFPDSYVGYYYVGEIFGVKGDYKEAEDAFLKALEYEPSLDEARLELVKIYRLTKQDQKVIDMYKQILDRNPDNILAALELSILYKKADPKEAATLLKDLGKRSLTNSKVIAAVMQYLVLQKRMDDAIFVLEGLEKGAPESSEIAYAAAVVYYEKGDEDAALKKFKAVKSDSRFYENSLMHMGIIYYNKKEFDTGIKVLREGMDKVPDEAKPELIPYLTSFYKEKGMIDEAISLIQKGLLINSKDTDLIFELGVIYDQQGKTDAALEQMKAVLALNPEHADALNYLGFTYTDKGIKLDEAEAMIKKAMKLKPDNGYIIDSLGWVYFKKGLLDDALIQLKRAVALIPEDAVVLEHLGDIYVKMNDPEKARGYYEKALKQKDADKQKIEKKIESLESKGH